VAGTKARYFFCSQWPAGVKWEQLLSVRRNGFGVKMLELLERLKVDEVKAWQAFEPPNEGEAYGIIASNNPMNEIDPSGLYTVKPGVPPPSGAIDALLRCIEKKTNTSLYVTSTSDSHSPTDPHTLGLAVDVRYPSNPGAVLNAAACCGAKYAQDEAKNPSPNATGPHLHLQLVPGRHGGHGDLPSSPNCSTCSGS
jgi:hypothetical protein